MIQSPLPRKPAPPILPDAQLFAVSRGGHITAALLIFAQFITNFRLGSEFSLFGDYFVIDIRHRLLRIVTPMVNVSRPYTTGSIAGHGGSNDAIRNMKTKSCCRIGTKKQMNN